MSPRTKNSLVKGGIKNEMHMIITRCKRESPFYLCVVSHAETNLGHTKIGLSQKPARIGMITARQRIGLHAGPKINI